ncbi:unnamed protein product, partial [Menidia menidia]
YELCKWTCRFVTLCVQQGRPRKRRQQRRTRFLNLNTKTGQDNGVIVNKSPFLFYITAGAYVVRKIQASLSEGEKVEQPFLTPCSAKAEMKAGQKSIGSASAAAPSPEPAEVVGGAAAMGTSSETSVQKCGS